LLKTFYDGKNYLNPQEQTKLVSFMSTIQLSAIRCIASKTSHEACLSMPGTHDLLEIVGETMCIQIEFYPNSIEYKSNLDELVRLSNLKIEFSMNICHGIANFMQANNESSLVKIIFENFHQVIFNSIFEWKSLNHSFNLKIVTFCLFFSLFEN
jgi:hypothetical protein